MTQLVIASLLLCLVSLFFLRKTVTAQGFYKGHTEAGLSPSVLTLTFSQVTTWIFARSLLNSAILGFYYGIWGILAYACYYFSFITGWKIVDKIRFELGYSNIQSFLFDRFGSIGTVSYNFVTILRLISEVFANLLVIGLIFGTTGGINYISAILLFSVFTLIYSMKGGLSASLFTDKFQMSLFLILLSILFALTFFLPNVEIINNISDSISSDFSLQNPGVILILVALLQVISYPMHDPVMMDRGFIANRTDTKKSFIYAFYISTLCIIAFGLFGLIAKYHVLDTGMTMQEALENIMGSYLFMAFNLCLIVSAISTLDSTLSSSAKLFVIDIAKNTLDSKSSISKGRVVMIVFMLLGLILLFMGNKDLFSAVAVSGTASMFLLPVITFCIFFNSKHIAKWSYIVSFLISIIGAVLYFLESSGKTTLVPAFLGSDHKYAKLLLICIVIFIIGHLAFFFGKNNEDKRT